MSKCLPPDEVSALLSGGLEDSGDETELVSPQITRKKCTVIDQNGKIYRCPNANVVLNVADQSRHQKAQARLIGGIRSVTVLAVNGTGSVLEEVEQQFLSGAGRDSCNDQFDDDDFMELLEQEASKKSKPRKSKKNKENTSRDNKRAKSKIILNEEPKVPETSVGQALDHDDYTQSNEDLQPLPNLDDSITIVVESNDHLYPPSTQSREVVEGKEADEQLETSDATLYRQLNFDDCVSIGPITLEVVPTSASDVITEAYDPEFSRTVSSRRVLGSLSNNKPLANEQQSVFAHHVSHQEINQVDHLAAGDGSCSDSLKRMPQGAKSIENSMVPFLCKEDLQEAKSKVRRYAQKHGAMPPTYCGVPRQSKTCTIEKQTKRKKKLPTAQISDKEPTKKRKKSHCLVIGYRFLLLKTFGAKFIMTHNFNGRKSRGLTVKTAMSARDKNKIKILQEYLRTLGWNSNMHFSEKDINPIREFNNFSNNLLLNYKHMSDEELEELDISVHD